MGDPKCSSGDVMISHSLSAGPRDHSIALAHLADCIFYGSSPDCTSEEEDEPQWSKGARSCAFLLEFPSFHV